MSEGKGWWEKEDSPEDKAAKVAWWPPSWLDRAVDWEPGMREFYILLIIVYVLWWADTGIF